MREVVIIDSVRTGLAKSFRGSFNQTRPDDLAAHCVKALVARAKLDPATIDDVIVGAGIPEGPQGMNIGRVVAVRAELPISVPGVTVSRFCASGIASSPWAPRRSRRATPTSSSPAAPSRSRCCRTT